MADGYSELTAQLRSLADAALVVDRTRIEARHTMAAAADAIEALQVEVARQLKSALDWQAAYGRAEAERDDLKQLAEHLRDENNDLRLECGYTLVHTDDAPEARSGPENADSVRVSIGDLNALRATISFLSSVIACGEPYSPEVKQAVANAHDRITRIQNDGYGSPASEPST